MPKKVKIIVKAIGVNRADLLQLKGKYNSPDGSVTPGLEVSGIRHDTGERVAALLTSGGYAYEVIADQKQLFHIPEDYSFVEAAALPQALVASWYNLFVLGNLQKNQSIVIHGGASGVGSLVLQIAARKCARVYTTAQNINKLSFTNKFNNCSIFSYDNFFHEIKNLEQVDLILDVLGGKYLNKNLELTKRNGKIISFAVMEGKVAEINLARLLVRNISLIGSTIRNKSINEKINLISNVKENLMPLIFQGEVQPIIDKVFNFKDYNDAHRYLEERKNIGKVILKI